MTDECECGNGDMIVVRDRNLDPAYMPGNKFARYCEECGRRYYCTEKFYKKADDQYVIREGEKEPVPIFDCPKDDCDETVTGTPDECPGCGVGYQWDTGSDEDENSTETDADAETTEVSS